MIHTSKKQEVRKQLLHKRNNEPYVDINEKSLLIQKNLENFDLFKQANTILFYISYDKEVSTHDLIKKTLHTKKKVIVPLSDMKTYTIIPSILTDWNHLSIGAYGILEPPRSQIVPIEPNTIDLVIIPGIGFDKTGNRMGHGKGYYDRFLPLAKKALRIGLCFEFQIIDQIPTEPSDQKVDYIITEERIITCKKYRT